MARQNLDIDRQSVYRTDSLIKGMYLEAAMSQSTAEVLILTINAIGAGILLSIARVLQPIMAAMTPLEFKGFLNRLVRVAMTEPVAITLGTLPILTTLLYVVWFGFGHVWFTGGLAIWLVGSTVTKIVNMPIYNWVADPRNVDEVGLGQRCAKLAVGNNWRAWLTLSSVLLMAAQFGPKELAVLVIISVVLSLPLVWLARRYIPGDNGSWDARKANAE